MTLDQNFENGKKENKALEEDISKNHASTPKTDEEKIAESTASGSLDVQAAEREMNRHLNEAGMLYQNLGESLRKMETVQKKIFLEQQSSIAKINLLKSQIQEQEEQSNYQKTMLKFLIALSLILGIATIVLVMMLKKETSQNQQFSQNEQSITDLIKRLEQAQLPVANQPANISVDSENNHKNNPANLVKEIVAPKNQTEETIQPNQNLIESVSKKELEQDIQKETIIEVEKTDDLIIPETSNQPKQLDTQNFKLVEPTETKKDSNSKPIDNKDKIKKLESEYFKALNESNLIKANQHLHEILQLNPNHFLKDMLSPKKTE